MVHFSCFWRKNKKAPPLRCRRRPRRTTTSRCTGLSAESPDALNAALQEAIESLRRTLYAPSINELTGQEVTLLRQAGADVEEHTDADDPMATYVAAFGAILATALSPAQAATRLGGVTQVRVRQMIREGTLHAVQVDGRWKIPVFQFDRGGLVPNIGAVNAVVPRTLDAVSVLRWYTTADTGLETPRRPHAQSACVAQERHGSSAGRRDCTRSVTRPCRRSLARPSSPGSVH